MKSLLFVAALVAVGACGATASDAVTPIDSPGCTLPGPTVRPNPATLHPGDTLRASASMPSCPLDPPVTTTFRWASSDSSVASVDSLSGLIRARALGTVTISAAATLDRNVKGAMLLVVAP